MAVSMKKLFIYLCFPFFLPVVLVAFLAACNAGGEALSLGMADLLDLSALAKTAGMDVEFLVAAAAGALLVQLLLGIIFIREVLELVPTAGKAAICSLIGVAGVTLIASTGVAFVTGLEGRVVIYWVAGGFGVPAFFGSLIAWRLLHPMQWVEPTFPE